MTLARELDMPEPEGEQPIFEDLTFPADELTFAEKEEEAASPSEPAAAEPGAGGACRGG